MGGHRITSMSKGATMNEQEYRERICDIHNRINRLNNAVGAMGTYNIRKYPDTFQEISIDAAIQAEYLACKLRNIIRSYGTVQMEEHMQHVIDAQGIQIMEANGKTEITIPRLLPKWKKSRSGNFINEPLYFALHEYCKTHQVKQYRECAVCYIHEYDEKLSINRIRDYDNLQLKQIQDIIATFFLMDDGGLLCDTFHTSYLGIRDCTRICIMAQEDLPEFIARLKSDDKFISNLDET